MSIDHCKGCLYSYANCAIVKYGKNCPCGNCLVKVMCIQQFICKIRLEYSTNLISNILQEGKCKEDDI